MNNLPEKSAYYCFITWVYKEGSDISISADMFFMWTIGGQQDPWSKCVGKIQVNGSQRAHGWVFKMRILRCKGHISNLYP